MAKKSKNSKKDNLKRQKKQPKSVSLNIINEILNSTEKITRFRDLDAILDTILLEARKLTNCDAGSIYLKEGENLNFSYVQNDSLFSSSSIHNKHLYYQSTIPINEKSIAGYVAQTGEPLIIKNVYALPSSVPYKFNKSFDEKTNYRTESMLVVPLKVQKGELVGVMQLINAKTNTGKVRPFTDIEKVLVMYFAGIAAFAIERGQQIREMIFRMIRLSGLRDPHETSLHVQRVGNYAIEIYEDWARKRQVERERRRHFKDCLKIAAMLHDVGKVAISDIILKKPGKLTEEEYNIMKAHTIHGARLFTNDLAQQITTGEFKDLDVWCAEVSLDHHERWDGTGYPGKIENIFRDPILMGPGKQKDEISLTGRIVALADVYDALISKRVYKNAWSEKEVLAYIEEQSGKHFDPSIVESFFSIYEVIQAIRERFQENQI